MPDAAPCAGAAAASGLLMFGLGFGIVVFVWPADPVDGQRVGSHVTAFARAVILANSVVVICGYFATAALIWGIADATMDQPRDLRFAAARPAAEPGALLTCRTSTPSASAMDFVSRADDRARAATNGWRSWRDWRRSMERTRLTWS